MRFLSIAILLGLCGACAPTVRETLMMDTASYTQCGNVVVNCNDDACSNIAGGPWLATACGTTYRCERTAGHLACVPESK